MRTLFTGCLVFLLASCSKKDCGCTTPQMDMTDTWNWVKSTGGIAGTTTTPASTGNNIVLRINDDLTYSYTINGTVTSSGTYIRESKNCIHDGRTKMLIDFSNDQDLLVEQYDNGELSLSDEAADGFISVYKRNQ